MRGVVGVLKGCVRTEGCVRGVSGMCKGCRCVRCV